MRWIRAAWVLLAMVHIGLGVSVAQWTMMQITDCELGLTTSTAACNTTLWNYFGASLLPVLAIPVVLCLVAAVACRPTVSWWVVVVMGMLTIAGFWSALGASSPSLMSVAGSLPGTLLALVLAVVQGGLTAKFMRPTARSTR